MESNLLISLPTIIVALSTLATLVPLVAGGVGLRKPGRNLRRGVGSHQHQGQEEEVHCGLAEKGFGLFFDLQVLPLGSFLFLALLINVPFLLSA